jgi:hypothetical protein
VFKDANHLVERRAQHGPDRLAASPAFSADPIGGVLSRKAPGGQARVTLCVDVLPDSRRRDSLGDPERIL